MTDAQRSARSVATAQVGLITMSQAQGAGLTYAQVRSLLARGEWERRTNGVLAVSGAPRSYEQDVLAACLAGGPQAVASHGTLARLSGLGRPYFDGAGVEITIPRGGTARAAAALGAHVHVTRNLVKADRAMLGPIPVTTPARLLVDLFGHAPDEAVFAVADDLLFHQVNPGQVRQAWARAAGGRHKALLDAALLPWQPGPAPGSPKEMSLCRVLELHGLPRPVRQHPVQIDGGRTRRYLDLAYPDARVAPEYDGRREHGPRVWAADADREDELARSGWVRLPAGRLDLVEPGATAYCDLVRAALAARAA